MLSQITVSPAPHIALGYSTRRVMLDVILSLVPAMAAGWWFFRWRAVLLIVVSVATCMAAEWVCNRMRRKPCTLGDLSAVVTGVILALSLPPAAPWWVAVVGGVFAIGVCKMAFGGLGANVFNPAMAARAFLTASFGALMTTWTVPATIGPVEIKTSISGVDSTAEYSPVTMGPIHGQNRYLDDTTVQAMTQATPLAWSKQAIKGKTDAREVERQLKPSIVGGVGGCLGETSVIALLLGAAYLLIRRTISPHIPAAVVVSAVACASIGYLLKPAAYISPWLHLCTGGMLLGAFFIATDPVTAPLTTRGRWVFGVGVGGLIMLIRMVGEYPEGVMYAVLIMNAFTPLIDRFCRLTPTGGIARG